jgi:uncharacterized repeat protein (TIGR01451 family)
LSAATLTVVGGVTILQVDSPVHGRYELRSQSDGNGEVRQYDPEKLKGVENDFVLKGSPDSGTGTNGAVLAKESVANATPLDVTPQTVTPVTIDVLMVYTTAAMNAAGGRANIVAMCQSAINGENGTWRQSDIVHQVRLVQTLEISHTSSGNLATDLSYVAGNSTVAAQRKTAGADVISYLSEFDTSGADGYGISTELTSTSGDSSEAYSAIYYDVVGGVWPHEMGHNCGCQHNSPGVYSYASGYYWTDTKDGTQWGTIMSYIGSRIPRFSNPDVNWYDSYPTGTSSCDNALCINNTGPKLAAYQTAKTLIEPSCAVASSTASPTVGTNFTLTVSTKNGGPSTASGVQITVTLPSQLTLVSNDSGGAYNTGSKVWSVPDVADGATANLVLTVYANTGSTGAVLTPTATLSSVGSGNVDYNLYNNAGSATVIPGTTPTVGVNRTWISTTANQWGTAASWNSADVPDTTGENAVFSTVGYTGTRTVVIHGTTYTMNDVGPANKSFTYGQLHFAGEPSAHQGWVMYQPNAGVSYQTVNGDGGGNPVILQDSACGVVSIEAGSGSGLIFALGLSGANEIQVNGTYLQIAGYLTNGVGVSAGLTKTGSGTLLLGSSLQGHGYTGDTTVSAGALELLAGNTLAYGSGYGDVVMNPSVGTATINLAGNSQNFNGLSSNGAGASVVEGGSGTPVLTVGNNNAGGSFGGVLQNTAGTLALTKTGSGTLTLSGANTYGGPTLIQAGTVRIQNSAGLGVGNFDATSWTIISSGASLEIDGSLTCSEFMHVQGTGVSGNGAIRAISGDSTLTQPIAFDADATIGVESDATLETSAGLYNNDATARSLTKVGGGTLTLSGANTYSGNTILNAGTLNLGVAETAGTSGPLGNSVAANPGSIVLNGGTLQYSAANQNDYSGRFSTASGQDYNIDVNGQSVSFDTALTSGGGSLQLMETAGGGILILTGTNTYSGSTSLNGGTLRVNGALAGGTVTVATGATLEGTVTIGGPVTVESGGNLSPGTSLGTLTISNDLTLAGNLFIEVNKSVSPANDLVVVTGTSTNAGIGTVAVMNIGLTALEVGDRFQLFNQPLLNGQAMTIAPAPGVGLDWTNNLAVDGSIAVVALAQPTVMATNLTITAAGPASFQVSGLGGANQSYGIYVSTNLMLPMTNWWLLGSTNADAGGVIQFLDTQATNAQRFYRFGQ